MRAAAGLTGLSCNFGFPSEWPVVRSPMRLAGVVSFRRPANGTRWHTPRVRFGLDFGTSNTSLAVWDGAKSTVLPIDPLAGEAMPTILYVRRDGSSTVGRPAIEAYLADNRARGPIKREYVSLGVKLESSNKYQR